MKLPLKGVIPPMITPLLENGELDEKGLENLIEHLISGGVHGIFLLGTNGEAPSLSYEVRKELVAKACKLIDKRVPVLVGISDTCLDASVDMANFSKEAGADAVVVAPPYYIPISEDEFKEYLEDLAKELTLPFILYNMPSCTKMHLSLDVVKKAKELGAIGIKDSSGDVFYLYSLLDEFENDEKFSIFVGTELFLPETIMNGGHGTVGGGANFFPKLLVDLYNASEARDLEKIDILRKEVSLLYNTIYKVGNHISRYTKGTKCALSVLGICEDNMAPPLKKFEEKERAEIVKYIEEFKSRGLAL